MTLQIEFPPQTEAWINAEAKKRGLLPTDLVRRVIEESAATSAQTPPAPPIIDITNAAAIAYLNRKLQRDKTTDPDEVRQADEELEELKRHMNANRTATGERLAFL